MGNEKANSILEANIPEDLTKPNSNDTAFVKL
jgi:hypothetical protein